MRIPKTCVPLGVGSVLTVLVLSGCTRGRIWTDSTRSTAVATLPATARPTMAVVPVSLHARDAVLVEGLSGGFSQLWSRETWGSYLPVIPDSGQAFDAVRATADDVQRTGQWTQATVERFAETSGCDYVLLLWVKNYGFGWAEMNQTKEIRLGYVVASTRTGQAVIAGNGEATASGRRESFDALETEVLAQAVQAVIPLLPPVNQES